MKQALTSVLGLVLALSLVSCGKNSESLINQPNHSAEQVNSIKEESVSQSDAHDALNPELYSQIKALMDVLSLHFNSYYKLGDANKTSFIWDGGCLGIPINEEIVHLYASDAIQDTGVCFELSQNRYGSTNDLTVICQPAEILGKVYIKVSGTINLYSEAMKSDTANLFNDVEFILDDMATYLNLTALSENDSVESQDFDGDGLVESYANYSCNNKQMLKIYDFVNGEIRVTAPEEIWGSATGSSACSDCANIKSIYSNCIFVYSDNKEISGVYSYSDGALTKECENDANQYCEM